MYPTNAKKSLRWFSYGKMLALIAGLLVLEGSALVLWLGEATEDPKVASVAGIVDGQLVCGRLERSGNGAISVGNTTGDVTGLITVAACP
jgi:hypothetical protein